MQGASVFAESTTLGTATDENGRFTLWLPDGGYDIAVSYTGYATQSSKVSNGLPKELNFELFTKEKTMQEVSVVSTGEVKDGKEKYGQFFLDEFIGKTPNSKYCTIKNPDVLKYFYSKRKNRLKILANEPLQIENRVLGYYIFYELDSFVHEYNSSTTVYTGFPRFETMKDSSTEMQNQWAQARTTAYHGSLLQFMRTLYKKELSENGYELQELNKINGKDTAMPIKEPYQFLNYKTDSSALVSIEPNNIHLGIIFSDEEPMTEYLKENPDAPTAFQFSTMEFLPSKKIFIESNGYYYPQNELTVNDYWEWSKIADALPYDYQPEQQ